MFDHVTIRVSDRAASEAAYARVLETLGIEVSYSDHKFAEWRDFSMAEADAAHPVTRNLHIGFVAPSREQVDAFHAEGVACGLADDGAPGPRPQYMEDYYGAFLRDADGNSIEAVHDGALRTDGVVDHLWLRTPDVAAAAGFYKLVAPIAGFGVRADTPERATFRAPARGGSISFVPGDVVTENVHLAFPGTEDQVRRFHAEAIAAGYRDNGAPGERPQYHQGYYAAYVLDPDGHNVEVVDHHRDEA